MSHRLVGSLNAVKKVAGRICTISPLRVAPAVLSLWISTVAVGQSPDARNAATWYRKSIERLGAIEISDAEWQAIQRYRQDPGSSPDDSIRAVLARVQPVLSAFQRGTQQAYSDFELDLTQGFDLELPHLSQLQSIGRLAMADAAVRIHDGDASAAADRLASLYRVADHLGGDGPLISSLVGQAVYRGADGILQTGLDQGAFGPAESGRLRQTLVDLSGDDTLGVLHALQMEQTMVTDWVRQKYAEASDRATMLEDLGNDSGTAEALAGMLLLDEQRFEGALAQTEQLMGRVRTAFELDDPEEAKFELAQIATEVRDGEHGPLAMIMVPNFEFVYDRMVELQETIAERLAVLGAIESGLDPRALANAAVWYLRAFAAIQSLDPPVRAKLRNIADDPHLPVDDAPMLAAIAPIVETLREGSSKPGCDFSVTRRETSPFVPVYLAGMREAARLLHADAIGRLQAEQPGPAADRLAICYRMSAHLAEDPRLLSSVTAQVIFEDTTSIARWGRDLFKPAQRAAMLEAARGVGRRDPFGYLVNLGAARVALLETLPLPDEGRPRAAEAVGRLNGDQLVYLLAVAAPPDTASAAPVEPEGLEGIISYEDLEIARSFAEQVRDFIAGSGDLDAVFERPVPTIAKVHERFQAARSTLGRALTALQATEETSEVDSIPSPEP